MNPDAPAVSDRAPSSFAGHISARGATVVSDALATLQVNVGKLCNQPCAHCHVDAGPSRREVMGRETADACLVFLAKSRATVMDITGGAPELCPEFERLVTESRRLGRAVFVRCNLTVIFAPGKQHLPAFYRDNGVQLFCSLPCYLEGNVDRQRGKGVYTASIDALRELNAVGYGDPDSGLVLNLVYNPVGIGLPPPQGQLEQDYRTHLAGRFGIRFSNLLTIANMPISRFAKYLRAAGKFELYMQRLRDAFEWANLDQLMCRSLVSVGWQGHLYDCDFNQMLDMPLRHPRSGEPLRIQDVHPQDLEGRRVLVDDHCFGCAAGTGSSCTGALRPSGPGR
jgi:radical SAM/Cys-rich protein